MNYFAHARDALDDPYRLAGVATPDWLGAVDRKVRVRSKAAQPYVDADDQELASFARGIVQHHFDDRWFHQTRAFAELNLSFTLSVRDLLPGDEGFRPSFVGHILVEMLLDAVLIADAPADLDRYYATVSEVDPQRVQDMVNDLASRATDRLAVLIPRFCEVQFLYDYLDDGKLLKRLNNVMSRVQLPHLPEDMMSMIPQARRDVSLRRDELMGA